MKFKDKTQKFEWDILELNEEDYIKKIILLKPFSENNDNLFDYLEAREKWNNSTNGKRFKGLILNSLNVLQKENFEYSDVVLIYKTLTSILNHIFIELEYYENNRMKLKEFLKVTSLFLEKVKKLLDEFNNIILNPNKLNNYKNTLNNILNYFNDF